MSHTFNFNVRGVRSLLVLGLVAAVWVVCFIGARRLIGNAIGLTAFDKAGLVAAQNLAPTDAQTFYAAAVLNEDDDDANLKNLGRAVAARPFDYRLWLEFAQRCERAGDGRRAEAGLRRAVELAPHYAFPRWARGNFLLRQATGETNQARREALLNEAFADLRIAGTQDASLQPQIANLAWRFFGGEVRQVSAALGVTASAQASVINLLLAQNEASKTDHALHLWLLLDEAQRGEIAATGARVRDALIKQNRFHDALRVENSLVATDAAVIGTVLNGDFEKPIEAAGKRAFGWNISVPAQTDIQLDPNQRRDGARSLRLIFTVSNVAADLTSVKQFIAVEPNARYRLHISYRTQDLQTASAPVFEVIDADAKATRLAASAPLANGTSDWQDIMLEFKPTLPAVTFRLNRVPCGDALCPLFGRVWVDGVRLEKL